MMPTLRQRGFSLIEAMVALLVIAVGLLGVAGLQALSLNSTSSSRVRALAAIEASNMAAYIGANASYWRNLGPGGMNVSVMPGTPVTLSDANLDAITTDCASGTCTPQQMAAYDLKQWGNAQQLGHLPAGEGAVSCGISGVCTVTVGWSQKTMTASAGGTSLASAVTYFRMVVQP